MRQRGLANIVVSIVACAVLVVIIVMCNGVARYMQSTAAEGKLCAPQVIESIHNHREAVAWLRVDGTGINAPIMQHSGNDAFYLSHDADGVLNSFGALFIQHNNHASFEDRATVIYGHAVLDGSMFGSLTHFAEPSFFDTHKRIEVCTPAQRLIYQIVAAYRWGSTWLFDEFALSDAAGVREYVQGLAARARLQGGMVRHISFDGSNGRLLVLSTCDQRNDEQRFLVHAVRIEAEDE